MRFYFVLFDGMSRMRWQQRWLKPVIQCLHGKVNRRKISGGVSTSVYTLTAGNQTWRVPSRSCHLSALLQVVWNSRGGSRYV